MELHAFERRPVAGQRAMANAHDLAVARGRRDVERLRQATRARSPASGSGSTEKRCGSAAKTPRPSCAIASVLPCIRRAARTTLPPSAAPIAWWPRQTPRIGSLPAKRPDRRRRRRPPRPACTGPGESTSASGAQRGDAGDVDLVVAQHVHVCAELAEVLHQVEGEAVVVVDHEELMAQKPLLDQLGGAQHAPRLGLGLLPLELGHRVGDDAGRRLHVQRAGP